MSTTLLQVMIYGGIGALLAWMIFCYMFNKITGIQLDKRGKENTLLTKDEYKIWDLTPIAPLGITDNHVDHYGQMGAYGNSIFND